MEHDGFRAVNKPGKCSISTQGSEKDSKDRNSSCKERNKLHPQNLTIHEISHSHSIDVQDHRNQSYS